MLCSQSSISESDVMNMTLEEGITGVGEREGWREGGREGGKERAREDGRERGKEGGRVAERERERERERVREHEREEAVRHKGIFTRDNNYCNRKGAKGVKQYESTIYLLFEIKQIMTERKLKSMHAGVITFILICRWIHFYP